MLTAPRVMICGVPIDNLTMEEALNRVEELVRLKSPAMVVTPNADHIIKLQSDVEFRRIYESASLVLADGMPLVWASHFLGTPLKERVTGSDIFPLLCGVAARKGYRVFFLGGRSGAAEAAAKVLTERYTGLSVAGLYSPPVGFENDPSENEKIIRMVRESCADILFVGLGAPKQEKWADSHRADLGPVVSLGIGVSFEMTAGMVKRAPVWMRNIGLEWFWRLLMEPNRLWRRYLVEDPVFFWLVFLQKLKRTSHFICI